MLGGRLGGVLLRMRPYKPGVAGGKTLEKSWASGVVAAQNEG